MARTHKPDHPRRIAARERIALEREETRRIVAEERAERVAERRSPAREEVERS